MTQYGFKAPAMAPEVIAELQRKYHTGKVTPVSDGVAKIPPAKPEVCGASPPIAPPRASSSSPMDKPEEEHEHPVDKSALIAKIAGNHPNMSPAYRLLADSKLCIKVSR
ncbi:uncharacterized protein BXIN_1157 [Babesia sp. Xinjiang]|uniref:uncharacterized protein n=1 Tax=Babesia sp. Xinjiang TaxID=462227 RepID=UPI000A21A28D|nr:uncharacterized protein BXIN_1157 [Babesia sp. Xinjiang]ORM40142.1 hypothetical protein BXIN_1157 [Babesia sp. Xinjiang]